MTETIPTIEEAPILSTRIIPADHNENFKKDVGELKIPKEKREGAIREGENKRLFWNTLASTIPESGYTPPEDRSQVILDIGCGSCIEGQTLKNYFGGEVK